MGEYESKIIGLRSKSGMEEARRNGRITCIAPVGYLNTVLPVVGNTIVFDEERAHYIVKAFEMYASEDYIKADIVKHLNAEGYISRRGKKLHSEQLTRILKNRVYAGYVFINKEEGWTRGIFKPIISEKLFEAVERRLYKEKAAKEKAYTRVRKEFPLKGHILCGKCERPLTGSFSRGKSGKLFGYYHCYTNACKGTNVSIRELEEAYVNELEHLVPTPEFAQTFTKAIKTAHRAMIEQMDEKRRNSLAERDSLGVKRQKLIDMYLDGEIQQAVYEEQYEQIQKKMLLLSDDILHCSGKEKNLDKMIRQALRFLRNAATTWVNGDIKKKREFQITLFPGGLTYTKDGKFGTPLSSMSFNYLEVLNTTDSHMATPTGIEPVLPA